MKSMLAALAALAFSAATAYADYSVTDEGTWPTSWPKELEPLRKQARSLRGSLADITLHEVPFANREEFEAAWPHLLAVKTKGAPIILVRSPDTWMGKLDAGVRIHCPPGQVGEPVKPVGPTAGEGRTRWLWTNYIELVVDGKVIDLNRIPLPDDTPIIDERFGGGKKAAPPGRGGPAHEGGGPEVGEALPEVVAVDGAGDSYPMRREDLKGKVVLLTFWSLDPKSMTGMPLERLEELSREFADDQRFHIITVCVNGMDDWDAWGKFCLRHARGEHKVPRFEGFHWWVMMQSDADEPTTARRYGVADTPAYFLVDADGRLAAVRISPEELRGTISRLLEPNP
jgi:hypothetical protein